MKKQAIISAVVGALATTSAALALGRFIETRSAGKIVIDKRGDDSKSKKPYNPAELDLSGIKLSNEGKNTKDVKGDADDSSGEDESGSSDTNDSTDDGFITQDACVLSVPKADMRLELRTDGCVYFVDGSAEPRVFKTMAWPKGDFDIYVTRAREYIVLFFVAVAADTSRFLPFDDSNLESADCVMVLDKSFSPHSLCFDPKRKGRDNRVDIPSADGGHIGENVHAGMEHLIGCHMHLVSISYVVDNKVYSLDFRKGEIVTFATINGNCRYYRLAPNECIMDFGEYYLVTTYCASYGPSTACYKEGRVLRANGHGHDYQRFIDTYDEDKQNRDMGLLEAFYDKLDTIPKGH